MKRTFTIALALCLIGLFCLSTAYWFGFLHWTEQIPKFPEKEVMWRGYISTTNGWKFKIENVLSFGRRSLRHIEFCQKTRQIFVAFGDERDDCLDQWDIDERKHIHTFQMGKGFYPVDHAISPDGKYLVVRRQSIGNYNGETLVFDVAEKSTVKKFEDVGLWFRHVPDSRIWEVGQSKSPNNNPGLFFKDKSGRTNLLTRNDYLWKAYGITKDGRIIVSANHNEEIVIWDAESAKEIARRRITNHEGVHVIYDEAMNRFLIADRSYEGTTYLRALVILKQPPLSN